MRNTLAIGIASLIVAGCVITPLGGFKAPPDTYQLYKKVGASDFEIKKALLECGYADPYNGYSENPSSGYQNQAPFRYKCMTNDGFVYQGTDLCSIETFKNVSACQPDGNIPSRSIERRLTSAFCKQYPRADVCQLTPKEIVGSPTRSEQAPQSGYIPPSRQQDQLMQLQRDMQNQSDSQMNGMLFKVAPTSRH